jgi:adenylate kinase
MMTTYLRLFTRNIRYNIPKTNSQRSSLLRISYNSFQTFSIPPPPEKPGHVAFADVEYDAMVDLFHHHARESGRLNFDGVKALLESIGERPSPEEVQEIFRRSDLDGNGYITLSEFLACADQVFLAGAPARIVLVVGGPGSGKGALCKKLEQHCHVVHLSSGDLLREEVERDTILGREVAEIMKRGELVSSAVIVSLVRRRMRHHPGKRVLLDGFPRSLQNAHDMVELCGKPELALHLECDDTVMLERILNRNDNRADDNFETALQRLRTYHKSHHTTMEWLKDQGVPVVNLDCSGTKEHVWDQLLAIGRLMRPACAVSKKKLGSENDEEKLGPLVLTKNLFPY